MYSWRISPELKAKLEEAARSERTSLAMLLDRIAREWLAHVRSDSEDEEEQRRIHETAARCFGKLQGGDPHLAEQASARVREALEERYGRTRTD